jgi:hypothetical protein
MRRWVITLCLACGCGSSVHHPGADGAGAADAAAEASPEAAADAPTADAPVETATDAALESAGDASEADVPAVDANDATDAADVEAGPQCDVGAPDAGEAGDAHATWQIFGQRLGSPTNSQVLWPALTLLPDDRPVVSWFEDTGIQTRIWEVTACGGRWSDPSGLIVGDSPALTTDAQGAPILAFDDYAAKPAHVVVRRLEGGAFVPLGAPLPSTDHGVARAVTAPALAADAGGALVLAWVDFPSSASSSIHAARWNGAAWALMTDAKGALGALASGSPSGPSLVLTPDGDVVASWLSAGNTMMVARYVSGTTWTSVGAPPAYTFGGGESNGSLLAVGKTGALTLAWKARTALSTYHTFVSRYDGATSTWNPLGGALATAGSASDYALMVDADDAPVVLDSETFGTRPGGGGFSYRWNGTTWESPAPTLPMSSPDAQSASAMRLVRDHHGRWVAAWIEGTDTGRRFVVVARWQP